MTNRLDGLQVLVTRPFAQANQLCGLIEQQGGRALRFPTLEIDAVAIEPQQLDQALQSNWLIFTSTNAVDFALKAFGGKITGLSGVKLAAVGLSTAQALQQAGLEVACVPKTEFSSEGLLAEADMRRIEGRCITIVRGVGGREKIAETLRSRNARVDYLEVYRRCRPGIDNSHLVEQLHAGLLSVTTITSGEALQNLLEMLDAASVILLKKIPLIVVSDRLEQLARQLGFERILVSPQPTDAAILQTLTMLLSGGNSGRSS